MSTSWWARQFGIDAPVEQQPSPTYPPQPMYPAQQPTYPPQQPQQPGYKRVVTAENYKEAIRDPASYEGLVTASEKAGDVTNCPECNSPRYFSRAREGKFGQNGPIPPKPMCADCGYPMRQGPGA